MDLKSVESIIELLKTHDLGKLKYKDDNVEIEVEAVGKQSAPVVSAPATEGNVSEQQNDVSNGSQVALRAEMVGTFYLQDEKELTQPIIKVGDVVKQGQVIGYIEAMKVLNEVIAPEDGEVVNIVVDHGERVEYDQLLVEFK